MIIGCVVFRYCTDTFQKGLRITTKTSLGILSLWPEIWIVLNVRLLCRLDVSGLDRGKRGLFWIRRWTFGFLEMRGISWVGERLSGSGEESSVSLWTAWFTVSWNYVMKIDSFRMTVRGKNGVWLWGHTMIKLISRSKCVVWNQSTVFFVSQQQASKTRTGRNPAVALTDSLITGSAFVSHQCSPHSTQGRFTCSRIFSCGKQQFE